MYGSVGNIGCFVGAVVVYVKVKFLHSFSKEHHFLRTRSRYSLVLDHTRWNVPDICRYREWRIQCDEYWIRLLIAGDGRSRIDMRWIREFSPYRSETCIDWLKMMSMLQWFRPIVSLMRWSSVEFVQVQSVDVFINNGTSDDVNVTDKYDVIINDESLYSRYVLNWINLSLSTLMPLISSTDNWWYLVKADTCGTDKICPL